MKLWEIYYQRNIYGKIVCRFCFYFSFYLLIHERRYFCHILIFFPKPMQKAILFRTTKNQNYYSRISEDQHFFIKFLTKLSREKFVKIVCRLVFYLIFLLLIYRLRSIIHLQNKYVTPYALKTIYKLIQNQNYYYPRISENQHFCNFSFFIKFWQTYHERNRYVTIWGRLLFYFIFHVRIHVRR